MPRQRKGITKAKKPPISFREAPEVQAIAAPLISEYHPYLAEAKICYLFRTGEWESRGRKVYGAAEKVSGKYITLTGYDFVITVGFDAWFYADEKTRVALVDHELCHLGRGLDDKAGNPKWITVPHMVEDFPEIIRRHGFWSAPLQRVDAAKKEHDKVVQMKLPMTGTEG